MMAPPASSASARRRGRSPGLINDEPSLKPAPPASTTELSSSRPCGAIRPQNSPAWWEA